MRPATFGSVRPVPMLVTSHVGRRARCGSQLSAGALACVYLVCCMSRWVRVMQCCMSSQAGRCPLHSAQTGRAGAWHASMPSGPCKRPTNRQEENMISTPMGHVSIPTYIPVYINRHVTELSCGLGHSYAGGGMPPLTFARCCAHNAARARVRVRAKARAAENTMLARLLPSRLARLERDDSGAYTPQQPEAPLPVGCPRGRG